MCISLAAELGKVKGKRITDDTDTKCSQVKLQLHILIDSIGV